MDARGALPLKPGQTVKGHIPAVEVAGPGLKPGPVKLIPWQRAAFHGSGARQVPNAEVWANDEQHTQVPQHMIDQMYAGLPAPVRRTAAQRYQSLVQRLMAMGRESMKGRGYPVWPESIALILDAQGIKRTDTDLHKQVYALAKHFITKSENQQRAKDRKQVVLGWHGHYD